VTESSSSQGDESGPDEGGGEAITLTLGNQEIVLRQRFEIVSIINEIAIAICFTVGSVLLGVRPGIRFARRVQLRKLTRGMPHEIARDF